MAWRIDEHVVRGEIDNRARDRVTGRIWFAGRADPVVLDLTGNTWRDLAGRQLEFVNPDPKPGLAASFAARQAGPVGDMSASRKVKVPDIPLDQIGEYYARGEKWPWHWGNCLYLEWFSAVNGRVVIESPFFQLTIVGDATWDMTPAEEETQQRANQEAILGFMQRMSEMLDRAHARADELASADEDPPTETEQDDEPP